MQSVYDGLGLHSGRSTNVPRCNPFSMPVYPTHSAACTHHDSIMWPAFHQFSQCLFDVNLLILLRNYFKLGLTVTVT